MARYTFLLPVYKAQFLDESLKSIIGQTYTDFNVLISDDCSPDNIELICKPYLEDSRFTYRRNEKNMGSVNLVSHWNFIIELCDSEYLILASDDDIYDNCFLEEIDKLTKKYPEVNLFRARSRKINDKGEPYLQDFIYEEIENGLNFVYSSFSQDRVHCIGNYVFKTTALKNNGGFVEFPMAWFSDDATVFSCGLHGVANTRDILFSFRLSPFNISNSNRKDSVIAKKKIDATCSFFEWMGSFVKRLAFRETLYNQTMFDKVCEKYKERVRWQISSYYCQLNYKSLLNLIKWMKTNKIFASFTDRLLFFMRWMRYKITN